MSFLKKKKGKEGSPKATRKGSSGNLSKHAQKATHTSSGPAIGGGRKTEPTKGHPSPKSGPPSSTPSSTKKQDDEDEFWGTGKVPAVPSMGGPVPSGAPSGSPATPHPSQFSVPPGYIPTGFAVDQYGQTVMVLMHAQTGQSFYQPVPPSTLQQYGFQSPGTQGSGITSPPPYPQGYSSSGAYPQNYYTGGVPPYGTQGGPPQSPQNRNSMPSGYPQSSGYPSPQTNGGYPSSGYPQQNGGGSYPTPTGYPQQPQQNGSGASPYPPTGYTQPPLNSGASPYPPQYSPTGYPQGPQYLSPPNQRDRSASFDSLPSAQASGLAINDNRPLAQSAETPQQNPPQGGEQRPHGGKETKSPSIKRNILINQHRFGEEFGGLSMMREARRKARHEEKKKTGGIKVLPTLKGPPVLRKDDKKAREAHKLQEERRRQRELEAKIHRDAEEKARQQEERMLRDVEERLRKEEEERRKALEEEMNRKRAEEERKWAEEEAKVMAQLEQEKRKRLEAEEQIEQEKERKKKELEELQRAREEQRRIEEQRRLEEEKRNLQERIEKEKNWAKQSFNPEQFRKQMEQRLREEMEKQLKEEQEKMRKETMVWEVRAEEVTTDKPLGKGAFGMVYSGKLRGKRVAIKTILVENINEENIASFKKEVDIMTKLRHPNILLFMGACFQPGNFMLITEFMPKGSLDKIIHEKKEQLTFKQRMKIAKDTALGMNWLHTLEPPFLHLDLKLGNLLVDENWNVKVADFGLSKIKTDCVTEDEGFIGSPFYMAPEMLQEKEYNEKADVYSFGIVLWELYTMKGPYEGRFSSLEEFIEAIVVDEERPDMPPDCPTTLCNLIESCWQTDPQLRPSFARILEASLFDCIIIEELIKDPHGRDFWKEKFLEQDVADWDEFMEGFWDHFHISPEDLPANGSNAQALKAVLVPHHKEMVTLEAFGNCLEWFGPLHTGMNLIQNTVATVSQSWFHGEMTREEAELQLKPKREGAYLIRFSASTPGSFTLSVKHQKKKFLHLRISRTPEGQFEYNKQLYPSIDDFLQAHKVQLNLKTPCSGSPFQDIFAKPVQASGKGDGQYAHGEEYGNFGQLTFN